MQVRAFGLGPANGWTVEDIQFGIHDVQPNMELGGADLVILPARIRIDASDAHHKTATELLERRILAATEGGQLVALIYGREDIAESRLAQSTRRFG